MKKLYVKYPFLCSFLLALVLTNVLWMLVMQFLTTPEGKLLPDFAVLWYAMAVTSNTVLLPVGWMLMYQMYPQFKMELEIRKGMI